jgi:ferritin-like metal-binding protein YciE
MSDHNFIVHTNGDTAKTLKESFMGVLNDVSDVETALRECAPNMRNYYPLPNAESAFDKDRSGWIAQMKKLEEIKAWATSGALRAMGEKE